VVDELEIALERPRSRTDAAVVELRERALEALGQGSPARPSPQLGEAH
jgi:hypothetical protein